MEDTLIANRIRDEETGAPTQRHSFEVLQELTRHGYVADPQPPGGNEGIVLRHVSGPTLVLREDGTVHVPLGQAMRRDAPPAPLPPRMQRKVMWRRGLAFLALLLLTTMLSLAILITIVNNS